MKPGPTRREARPRAVSALRDDVRELLTSLTRLLDERAALYRRITQLDSSLLRSSCSADTDILLETIDMASGLMSEVDAVTFAIAESFDRLSAVTGLSRKDLDDLIASSTEVFFTDLSAASNLCHSACTEMNETRSELLKALSAQLENISEDIEDIESTRRVLRELQSGAHED